MTRFIFGCLVLILSAAVTAQDYPKREMRAAWIATVENIDWPSKPGLPAEVQKKELTELLDLVKEYNMNSVVLQIRPAADAFYPSSLEPWSQWLTGTQGKAPEPYYDPLEFAVSECHRRGLDLHVWLNPYRAVRDTAVHNTAPNHITKRHPDWFITYGSTVYFDPGLPETRNHVASVVSDIVRRYDIDAIHMDDYFYPYRIAGQEFPDDSSFTVYHGEFEESQRDDWRRNNVDLIIRQLHDSIRRIKPWVEFGISPFGVWRNSYVDSAGSATRAGQTNYDDLFADILKWQKEGWIDYVAPQLYWQIGMKIADYAVLAEWWSKNTFGCPLYIGHAIYRIDPASSTEAWRSSDEIVRQIRLNRSFPEIKGSILYSAKFLRSNPMGLKENLKQQVYKAPALIPLNNRIAPIHPEPPKNVTAAVRRGMIQLTWEKGNHSQHFVIYKFSKKEVVDLSNPEHIMGVTADSFIVIPSHKTTKLRKNMYVVTALSPTHHESEGVEAVK